MSVSSAPVFASSFGRACNNLCIGSFKLVSVLSYGSCPSDRAFGLRGLVLQKLVEASACVEPCRVILELSLNRLDPL